MNRIVKDHYPAARLPEDLREGLDLGDEVRVTIEIVSPEEDSELANWFQRPERVLSLDELFALRRPPFKSSEEIERELQQERDAWDD